MTILNYISGSTDYSISYDDVRTDKGVYTVSFDCSPVESALKSLLVKSPFTFSVNGRQIKVFKLQSGEGQSQTGKKYRAVGKVVDAKGEPLPQSTVRVKGKNEGILADLDGNFDFPVSSEKGDLVISMVGFTSKTVAYASGKTQTVTLKEDAKTLGEVSVIAYGQRIPASSPEPSLPLRAKSSKMSPLPPSRTCSKVTWRVWKSRISPVPPAVTAPR